MKSVLKVYLILIWFTFSCANHEGNRVENWKEEIMEAEINFSKLSEAEGISKAFISYAADDAVINRNDSLIIGKENIIKRFEGLTDNEGNLTWKPDFIEVSTSGDLGYTYGHYTYTYPDSMGNELMKKGVFHTVWKRQADGSWKYVWD